MARLGSLNLKTLHTSYINKNWKETAHRGPVELENMFLIVLPSHPSWKNLSSKSSYRPHASLQRIFLKSLTESFERIPFLDLGGKKFRYPYESGKGWSFITTQMNRMEPS
jgi:hypothetical protein